MCHDVLAVPGGDLPLDHAPVFAVDAEGILETLMLVRSPATFADGGPAVQIRMLPALLFDLVLVRDIIVLVPEIRSDDGGLAVSVHMCFLLLTGGVLRHLLVELSN